MILQKTILPEIQYEQDPRALCLLDPYGLHLDWEVIRMAGQLKTVDMFLNFPVMDMNMNVLWTDQPNQDTTQLAGMSRFWGDESWRETAYSSQGFLFADMTEKQSNDAIAAAFRERLQSIAGFKNVPQPLAMRNSTNSVLYYLFFASPKDVANKIVENIFNKHRWGKRNGN